jgi:cytochrome oxidase Cu insertion factor (SCO1/SenC/PrrC family)
VTADPTLTTTQPTVEIATARPTADLPVAPIPGARAPDFTLTDLNGDEVTLGELRGQVVLLNFWATW